MNIGFLDRRITVQVQSTATRNAYGEVPPTNAYTDVATVWAARQQVCDEYRNRRAREHNQPRDVACVLAL